ncbi:MAG: hypothetical protein QXV19_01120 [Candidatus Bathyarchaeia archaeon]
MCSEAVGEREMKRVLTLRLVPDRDSDNKLKLLCSLSAKLWNEVNYVRRMFFENRGVDLRSTYREFYEKHKVLIGSATAQQVLNKNDETWRSFFSMLKAKTTPPSPALCGVGVTRPRPGAALNPAGARNVTLNLPGTPTL